MIALGLRYLRGVATATDRADRERAEWPPHPARIYMALAAAHFECRRDPPTAAEEQERRALEWLARQSPPAMKVSEACRRSLVTAYVPVNDTSLSSRISPAELDREKVDGYLKILPNLRSRQDRTFPQVVPEDDVVYLVWRKAKPERETRDALERTCLAVTRVGHSSSLVQMWVEDNVESIEPNLVPGSPTPVYRLRTVGEGMLAELEAAFPAVRPAVNTWEIYGPPAVQEAPLPQTVFDPNMIVLRLEREESQVRRLSLETTARVMHAFRGAVLAAAAEPIPEYVSGHREDGSPSQRTHLAFVPLPFVGHRHADGHLLGLAASPPRELGRAERQTCVHAVAGVEVLLLGRLGRWRLLPERREDPPCTLRPETWTRPAVRWASVTPVVFDRFSEDSEEKAAIVATSCERIGLPRPREVTITHVSRHEGVPRSGDFPPLPAPDGTPRRPYSHVILTFNETVAGPVLIGAGRYRGYGLCRPVPPYGDR